MKPWQRNYELSTLKRHAAIFDMRHRKLVFGAFGLVKERDIAGALAENRLAWASEPADPNGIAATALVHRLRAGSTHRDFTGRELRIDSGSVVASAFACHRPEGGAKLLESLRRKAGAALIVEAFEEDTTARTALDWAGFRYCMTKIAAGSEVKGMYSSCPSAHELPALPRSETAALEICRDEFATWQETMSAVEEIRAFEAKAPMWAQHYSSYNKRKSWTAIALKGFDPSDPSFIIAPREMSQAWKVENPARLLAKCEWTSAAESFPTTRAIVDRIPGEKERVRFMRLAAAGELSRHADITDRLAGTADGRITRVHIPLVTNPGVRFMAWGIRGDRVHEWLPPGALCFLDQRKPHAVVNPEPAERIHIVADVVSSPELRALLFERA